MGCNMSSAPLLADIYGSYEHQYDFEQIFPLDPASETIFAAVKTHPDAPAEPTDSPSTTSQLLTPTAAQLIVTDTDIDVHHNSANLSSTSSAHDILVDLNQKISKLIIRFTQYNGSELQPIIKLGMNESKHSPIRTPSDDEHEIARDDPPDLIMKGKPRGLLFMEFILSHWIRDCGVNVVSLCRRGFFPNDLKAVIISFFSVEPPKMASFRTLIPTAILCQSTLNLTEYIGTMMAQKLLFQVTLSLIFPLDFDCKFHIISAV